MNILTRFCFFPIGLIAIGIFLSTDLQAQWKKDHVNIGVLLDFQPQDTTTNEGFRRLTNEIQNVVGSETKVVFPPRAFRYTKGSMSKALMDYLALIQDPEVDIILSVGAVSSTMLASQGDFPKPTVSVGIIDQKLQNLPLTENGTSGTSNFTYILSAHSMEEDIEAFHGLFPFKRLAILASKNMEEALDQEAYFRETVSPLGAEVNLILFGNDLAKAVGKLNDSIDAVYLAMIFERDPVLMKPLADSLIERKLPSFTMGQSYVEAGFMACKAGENTRDLIFRKLALTIEGILLGEDLAVMPVRLNFREQLLLNAYTARKVGLNPSFETINSAKIINEEKPLTGKPLSFHDILLEGLEQNLEIRIQEQEVALTGQDVRLAKANLFPSIDAGVSLVQLDKNTAENSFGNNPERSGKASGNLTQIIFSEEAVANFRIIQYLNEAERLQLDQTALDVVLDLSTAYFNTLKAATNTKIQEENLAVSRRNLEISRTRNAVGYSGVADIYRWESEQASATQAMIEARNNFFISKVQLSRLLNRKDIFEDFDLKDAALTDSMFDIYDPAGVGQLLKNPRDVGSFTEFMVKEALNNLPTLKQIEVNKRLLARQEKMNRRQFYLPTVALSGQTNYTFWRDGAGLPDPSREISDFTWNVGLNLSYPIFQGNQRKIVLEQTAIQQRQIDIQLNDLRQKFSQSVYNQVTNLISRSTNLYFAKISAESADKNFSLIESSYRSGQLGITTVVDAQRSKLQAAQGYANAVYDYLVAFLELEYSIGKFTMLMTEAERQEFVQRIISFHATHPGHTDHDSDD